MLKYFLFVLGGDGCSDECNVFSVDCQNQDYKVTFHEKCLTGFYKFLSWENFYIGTETSAPSNDCKFTEATDISMTISYEGCSTSLATYADYIQYTNKIHYLTDDGLSFFTTFDVTCSVEKIVNTQVPGGFLNFRV